MPPGSRLGQVSHVGVDSRDHVYAVLRRDAVADPVPADPIVVFDAQGEFVGSWGKEWIADAHGIFITHDDVVFVADRDAHQICAFSRDGKLLHTLGRRHGPLEPFNHPADIAVGPDGDIYVADGYGNSQVHRFSRDGKLLRTWGRPGRGPGEFGLPHAVWVLRDGRVLVADRENCRVQVFTPEGEYLTEWPDFSSPRGHLRRCAGRRVRYRRDPQAHRGDRPRGDGRPVPAQLEHAPRNLRGFPGKPVRRRVAPVADRQADASIRVDRQVVVPRPDGYGLL